MYQAFRPILLFVFALLCTACVEDEMHLNMTGIDAEAAVAAYNADLPPTAADHRKAFSAVGTVTEARIEPDQHGREQLYITFRDKKKQERRFSFGLENDLDFPAAIDRAKVIYLGHQLVVIDLKGSFYAHLMVPDENNENLLPGLPYTEGFGLGIATGNASLGRQSAASR